eukprot:10325654-Alexandrium_andersonii.AAC.1
MGSSVRSLATAACVVAMTQPSSPALDGGGQRPTAQLGKRPSTPARQRPCVRPSSRQARHSAA